MDFDQLLEGLKVEKGLHFAFSRIVHYLIMITGTVVAFQFIGLNLNGLAVIFGFLSVGIGFGLQNITSNFVSGLILLFERPIKIGDRVTVGDTEGDVVAINMRSTTIRVIAAHYNYRAELGVYLFPGCKLVSWRPQGSTRCAGRGFL